MRLSLLLGASLLSAGASAFNLKSVTAPEDKDDNSLLRHRNLSFMNVTEYGVTFNRTARGGTGDETSSKGSKGKGGTPGDEASSKGSKGGSGSYEGECVTVQTYFHDVL